MVTPVTVNCYDWAIQTDSPYVDGNKTDNHRPTGTVTLSGNSTEGETLTCNNTLADEEGLGTLSYQWNRDGTPIAGATSSTYTLVSADATTNVTCTISYTDGSAEAESKSSAESYVVAAAPAPAPSPAPSPAPTPAPAPGTPSYTPEWAIDFEGGTPGTRAAAEATDDLWTEYSTTQAYAGTQSGRLQAFATADGGGVWGLQYVFAQELAKGDEVWVRFRIFFPTEYNFEGWMSNGYVPDRMKFLRLHTKTSGGANLGYNDIYLEQPNAATYNYSYIYEGHPSGPDSGWTRAITGHELTKGSWHTFEYYLGISDKAQRQGGTGRAVLLKDGVKVLDTWDYYDSWLDTLAEATDTADFLYIFSYWANVGAPLDLTSVSGTFGVGNTVQGSSSGQTAEIIHVEGDSLYFEYLSTHLTSPDRGFTNGETITDLTSGATGTAVKFQYAYIDEIIITTNQSANGGADNTPDDTEDGIVCIGTTRAVADFP